MSTTLKKLIIEKLEEYNNKSTQVIGYLKQQGLWASIAPVLDTDGETLYNYLYKNTKTCPHNRVKFVSFSVGYRFCGKAGQCECATKSVASSVANTKSQYSETRRQEIAQVRTRTNLERYGVENVFQDTDKIKQSYINKLGVENPRQLESVNEKIRETNQQRYGVDNPSKNATIKEKQAAQWSKNSETHCAAYRAAMIRKHGVENPRQLESVNEKIRATNQQRYGVDNPSKNTEIAEKISNSRHSGFYNNLTKRVNNSVSPEFSITEYCGTVGKYCWKCNSCGNIFFDTLINGRTPVCRTCHPKSVSNFEKDVREYLATITSDPLLFNNRELIAPKELDIVIPSKQLAIECNGVYWHSELNGKNRSYHLDKTKQCAAQGYRLIHIYDVDWYTKPWVIKSILQSALGQSQRIYAKNLKVVELSTAAKRDFINTNHLQGDAPSKVNLGLEQNGQLVAAMTLGQSRYNKQVQWEIIRYCQLCGTNVVGGASKLFKRFIKEFQPSTIISYSDRSIFSGNMYKQLGFELTAYSAPGYRYFSKTQFRGLESRVKYQKHKLSKLLPGFNPDQTEWQNMLAHGYDRVWDCGNGTWVWQST